MRDGPSDRTIFETLSWAFKTGRRADGSVDFQRMTDEIAHLMNLDPAFTDSLREIMTQIQDPGGSDDSNHEEVTEHSEVVKTIGANIRKMIASHEHVRASQARITASAEGALKAMAKHAGTPDDRHVRRIARIEVGAACLRAAADAAASLRETRMQERPCLLTEQETARWRTSIDRALRLAETAMRLIPEADPLFVDAMMAAQGGRILRIFTGTYEPTARPGETLEETAASDLLEVAAGITGRRRGGDGGADEREIPFEGEERMLTAADGGPFPIRVDLTVSAFEGSDTATVEHRRRVRLPWRRPDFWVQPHEVEEFMTHIEYALAATGRG